MNGKPEAISVSSHDSSSSDSQLLPAFGNHRLASPRPRSQVKVHEKESEDFIRKEEVILKLSGPRDSVQGCSNNLADFLDVDFMDVEMKLHDILTRKAKAKNGMEEKGETRKKREIKPILKNSETNERTKGKEKKERKKMVRILLYRRIYTVKNWKEYNKEADYKGPKGLFDDCCCEVF